MATLHLITFLLPEVSSELPWLSKWPWLLHSYVLLAGLQQCLRGEERWDDRVCATWLSASKQSSLKCKDPHDETLFHGARTKTLQLAVLIPLLESSNSRIRSANQARCSDALNSTFFLSQSLSLSLALSLSSSQQLRLESMLPAQAHHIFSHVWYQRLSLCSPSPPTHSLQSLFCL